MKLAPGEHSILATFSSITKVKEAQQALENAGINNSQIDRISRYGVTEDKFYNNPLAGQAGTLTGLTIYSENQEPSENTDTGVLLAADPSVSGMAGTNYGAVSKNLFLLTIVTSGQQLNQALKIIKEYGGEV